MNIYNFFMRWSAQDNLNKQLDSFPAVDSAGIPFWGSEDSKFLRENKFIVPRLINASDSHVIAQHLEPWVLVSCRVLLDSETEVLPRFLGLTMISLEMLFEIGRWVEFLDPLPNTNLVSSSSLTGARRSCCLSFLI